MSFFLELPQKKSTYLNGLFIIFLKPHQELAEVIRAVVFVETPVHQLIP
jgi:hypothetical protein